MADLSKKNCQVCQNAKWCRYIHPYQGFYCPGMEVIIDNHRARKEPLVSDLIGEGYEGFVGTDYKIILNEIGENRETEHARRHHQIMEMPDTRLADLRRKAIAALLFFGVVPTAIARVLKISLQTVYNITGRDGE